MSPFGLANTNNQQEMLEALAVQAQMRGQSPFEVVNPDIAADVNRSLEQRKAQLASDRERLQGIQSKELGLLDRIDLRQVAGVVDNLTGSKFSQTAQGPRVVAQRQAEIDALRNAITRGQEGITRDQLVVLAGQERGEATKEAARLRMLQERLKAQQKGPKFTPAQEEFDKAKGKQLAEFTSKNDKISSDLARLKSVQAKLDPSDGKTLTGPSVGSQPDFIRKIINPDSFAAQQDVESVTQGQIKQVLDAQFGQREAAMILERAFDPTLPESVNQRKVQILIEEIESIQNQKQEEFDHFSKYGSLVNYKPKFRSASDIQQRLDAVNVETVKQMSREEKIETLKRRSGN